jgi:hypothetical protein
MEKSIINTSTSVMKRENGKTERKTDGNPGIAAREINSEHSE